MEILRKVSIVLIIAICLSVVMPRSFVHATEDTSGTAKSVISSMKGNQSVEGATDFANVGNKVLSLLQVASAIAAVLMIAISGFRYIIETPEVKGELKKNMLPIIIGIILVFFASTIAKFLISIFATGQASNT